MGKKEVGRVNCMVFPGVQQQGRCLLLLLIYVYLFTPLRLEGLLVQRHRKLITDS